MVVDCAHLCTCAPVCQCTTPVCCFCKKDVASIDCHFIQHNFEKSWPSCHHANTSILQSSIIWWMRKLKNHSTQTTTTRVVATQAVRLHPPPNSRATVLTQADRRSLTTSIASTRSGGHSHVHTLKQRASKFLGTEHKHGLVSMRAWTCLKNTTPQPALQKLPQQHIDLKPAMMMLTHFPRPSASGRVAPGSTKDARSTILLESLACHRSCELCLTVLHATCRTVRCAACGWFVTMLAAWTPKIWTRGELCLFLVKLMPSQFSISSHRKQKARPIRTWTYVRWSNRSNHLLLFC